VRLRALLEEERRAARDACPGLAGKHERSVNPKGVGSNPAWGANFLRQTRARGLTGPEVCPKTAISASIGGVSTGAAARPPRPSPSRPSRIGHKGL
jgi:hypothetical protein